jgi:hypothetical protein
MDSVVRVIGRGPIAEREGLFEVGFIFGKNGQGRFNTGPRGLGDNLVCDCRILIADVLEKIPHLVCGQGLEEAWEV